MSNAVALAIKVTSDARGASAGIDSATGKVSKLGQAGKAAGRLLAVGLFAAAGAAIKFANAAAADEAAATQLAQTAKKAAGATDEQTAAMESWITAQGKAVGVADDELRPAMSKLITATGDVGKAQKLAALAMDISARSGKSLDSVAQSLAKAQNGSVAGLSKYGVATKDAAGKAKSLADVQKALGESYSGAAAAGAETAAGKAKRLQVSMGELQEEIGAKLLPVLLKAAEYGLKVVDWIDKNQTAAAAIIGTMAALLAIVKIVSIATQLYATYQAILNAVMAANPVVLIVIALVALAAALVIAYKKSETFRAIVDAAFGAIQKVVAVTVDFIRDHWRLIISIIGGPIGLAVALVTKHWDTIKAGALAVIDWVTDNWPAIKELVVGPIRKAKELAVEAWDKISSGFTTAKDTISSAASAVQGALTGAFNAIRDVVQGVIDKVVALINKIQSIPGIPGSGEDSTAQKGDSYDPNGRTRAVVRTAPRAGDTHVHLHMHGAAFVGNDLELMDKLRQLVRDDSLRFNGLVQA